MTHTVIGLTGQTGAGKSSVAKLLEAEGFSVVDADQTARAVMEPGSPVLQEAAELFGADILREDGSLDRPLLAQRAFASPSETAKLNAVTHPAIVRSMKEQAESAFRKGCHYVVFDASQLFEAGMDPLCDRIVSVLADEDIRRARIMARDAIDTAAADRRMKAQYEESFFTDHSDLLIRNNGTLEELAAQVRAAADTIKHAGNGGEEASLE